MKFRLIFSRVREASQLQGTKGLPLSSPGPHFFLLAGSPFCPVFLFALSIATGLDKAGVMLSCISVDSTNCTKQSFLFAQCPQGKRKVLSGGFLGASPICFGTICQ